MVAGSRTKLNLGKHQVLCVAVTVHQLAGSLRVLWIACNITGDSQITQDAQGIEPALGHPSLIPIHRFRTKLSPPGGLAIDVHQIEPMTD